MNTQDTAPLERFRSALRIRTVWPEGAIAGSPETEAAEKALTEFQAFLQTAYPAFHSVAERTVLNPFGVVYRWPAAAASAEKPVLLLAHYDVVPVERERWTVDPFAAEVSGGFVYGRGTLDTKNSLICQMEAVERLAAAGFAPKRDIYLAWGGDEEWSGPLGAVKTAAYFAERGISFSWALDEGSVVADGMLSGVSVPLALIGVEEKGFLDLQLTVKQTPGHASRPPNVQAVAVLGAALARLGKKRFPFALTPTVEAFYKSLAPLMPPLRAAVLANARFLGPLFFKVAATTPETAALLRTTLAMTQLSGSPADNVMPSEATAILNLRLLSGWTIERATDWVRRAIGDDRVDVSLSAVRAANDPITASEEAAQGRGPGWSEIAASIRSCFPDAAILPFLVTATTDSRHYAPHCDAVYRFVPVKLNSGELARVHGHDERISIENFTAGIEFYRSLIATL